MLEMLRVHFGEKLGVSNSTRRSIQRKVPRAESSAKAMMLLREGRTGSDRPLPCFVMLTGGTDRSHSNDL